MVNAMHGNHPRTVRLELGSNSISPYPFSASILVKIFALWVAMSATAWAGVEDWYRSRFTYLDKSTHMWMLSVSFLGATMMGAHHSVFWSRSLSFSYGID